MFKIDTSGNIVWSKIVGGNGADWPDNATILSDGGIMISGMSQSFDGDISINYGSWDNWLVKLDNNGNIMWEYSIGTEGIEKANEIIEDIDGGVLIGGTSAHYGNGNIVCNFFDELEYESLLTKLDSNFNMLWQQCYGGSSEEMILSLISYGKDIYVNNSTRSNDGDLNNTGYHGGFDVWITKLDSVGNLILGKCYGGTGHENGLRSFAEENGDLTIFGITESNDGDVQGLHAQNNDIWIFKIDSIGNLLWQQCIGGNGFESISLGVKKISYNRYVIAAETFGSFGTGDITCNTTADSGYDIWFFKVTDTTIVSRNEDKFSKLKVFPNPASDFIRFESSEKIKGYFTLYNLIGEKVIDKLSFENDSVIAVDKIPSGIYLYLLTDKVGNFTANKLLIN